MSVMIMAFLPVIPRTPLLCLLLVVNLLLPSALHAASLRLDAVPDRPLGPELELLQESGTPLDITRALALPGRGIFTPASPPSLPSASVPIRSG